MTFGPDYKSVTMWDVLKYYKPFVLEKRVKEDQVPFLQAYLRPGLLSPEEEKEMEAWNNWEKDQIDTEKSQG